MLGLLLPCAIVRVLGAANVAIDQNKLLSGVTLPRRAAPRRTSCFSSSSLFVCHPSPAWDYGQLKEMPFEYKTSQAPKGSLGLTGQLANKFTAF